MPTAAQFEMKSVVLDPGIDIESLPVSQAWKKKFRWISKAGGPSLKHLKDMPKSERIRGSSFNILAFLFGPFYYVAKGMWRKGLVLFAVCFAAAISLDLILNAMGFATIGKSLGYGIAAVFSARANIDYYKKMVLKDNGWW